MYARSYTGWHKEKMASAALSVTINLAIFAGFAWFTSVGELVVEAGTNLVVFEVGAQGDASDDPAASTPPPTRPMERQPRPSAAPPQLVQLVAAQQAESADRFEPAVIAVPQVATRPVVQQIRQLSPSTPITPDTAAQQELATAAASQQASTAPSPRGRGDEYGASVYGHLMRARRGNTVGAGEVTLQFTVLDDGSAEHVSVLRSSGSSRFDREALQMVRRAAPFPRPPDGTSRTFRFGIKGG